MKRKTTSSSTYLITMISIFLIMSYLFWNFSKVVSKTELVSIDSVWVERIQGKISEQITPIMSFFTFLGSTTWLALATLFIFIVLFIKKRRVEAILFVSTMAFSGIFNQLLKMLYHRPRPTIRPLIEASGYSFPSGHSMASFTFYGLLAFFIILKFKSIVVRLSVIFLTALTISTVGISRIYLGVHYPTDVLAGFTAGAATLAIFLIAYHLTVKKIE